MAESQGNPPPNGGQGTDSPEGSEQQKYVTQDQLNEVVNRAITGRLTDFEKRQKNSLTQILADRDTKLAGTLTEALTERFGTALDEKLAALKPKDEEQNGKLQEPPPPPKWEDSPAYKSLQKELDKLKQANAESEQRRAEAEQKRRDVQLRNELSSELAKLGLTGERGEIALGYLVDAKKLVGFRPDSDEIVFRNGEDEIPLNDGLKTWSGTEYAKALIPPKGIQGSGDKPGGGSGGGNNRNSTPDLGGQLLDHFKRQLGV